MTEKDGSNEADKVEKAEEGQPADCGCPTSEEVERMRGALKQDLENSLQAEPLYEGGYWDQKIKLMACPGVGGPPDKEIGREIFACRGVGGPPDDEDDDI